LLGYTIWRCYKPETGRAYIGVRPAGTKVQRLKRKVSGQTDWRWLWVGVDVMAGRLNHLLRGRANYLSLGAVTAASNDVNARVCYRLRRWLTRRFDL
jgi:hypothetical protein